MVLDRTLMTRIMQIFADKIHSKNNI